MWRCIAASLLFVSVAQAKGRSRIFGDASVWGDKYRQLFERNCQYWSPHFAKTRELVVHGAGQVADTSRVTVLGAGESNDVPLEHLIHRFDEVKLVDFDEASLHRGIHRVKTKAKPSDLGKIEPVVLDVTGGAMERLYTDGIKVIESTRTLADVIRELTSIYQKVSFPKTLAASKSLRAPYVVSSGLLSQLGSVPVIVMEQSLAEKAPTQPWYGDMRYMIARSDMAKRGFQGHADLLADLSTSKGRVAVSDTVAELGMLDKLVGEQGPELHRRLASFLVSWKRSLPKEAALKLAALEAQMPHLGPVPIALTCIGRNILPIEAELALLAESVKQAESIAPQTVGTTLPGGIAGAIGAGFVPTEPIWQWLWVNDAPSAKLGRGRTFRVEGGIFGKR